MKLFRKLRNAVDKQSLRKSFNKAFKLIVYCFAFVGFVLVFGYVAIRLGLTNERGVIDNQRANFLEAVSNAEITSNSTDSNSSEWASSEEWQILRQAIIMDEAAINKAASATQIEPRLIVAQLVPEQLRLFHDNREIFKQILAPLKILGNQSQFSWGIVGIKRETAIAVEEHLKSPLSPFYLGKEYENLLDFTSKDIGSERFARITDENDHYYSYLYAALYLKQIMKQWQNAGFDISNRPDILSTLYNIGFNNSYPNADPHSGGAIIEIGGKSHSFGSLATEFYYSDELRDYFP